MTSGKISEGFASALVTETASAKIAEAFVSALTTGPSFGAMLAEGFVSALVYRGPCFTQRCDLWTISRKDGMVFAFTSLDRDFTFGSTVYKHCASLQDTASDSASELGSVGSVELTGILADDAITDEDIYAGLYDDAYVEMWRVDWGNNNDPASPYRVAAGWIGTIQFGQTGWKAEVLGPGQRLRQTSMVKFYQPACRWVFGDSNCTVDVEALQIRDIRVTGTVGRGILKFAPIVLPGTAYWNSGSVVWTYGKNAGQSCEVDTADGASGILSLWALAPFPPQIGDAFDLLPGCPLTKAGCVLYDNLVNFGGFDLVPGADSLQQNADSLFGI